MNMKEFFDFNTKVESKSYYNMTTLKGILNQKQNFIFQRNQKGIFGDYELFFEIPSLLTGTVVSDRCILYNYKYEDYKKLSEETYLVSDSLKHNAFHKLKSLLKRMIMVYNSYWRLHIEQLAKNLQEKEQMLNIINIEEKETTKKSVFNSTNVKNSPFIDSVNNFKSNDKNNSLINGISIHDKNNLFYRGTESSLNNQHNFLNTFNTLLNTKLKGKNIINPNNYTESIDFINTKNIITDSNSSSKLLNKNFQNKKLTSKSSFNKKVILRKILKNELGKEEKMDHKSINDEEYQKQLIKNFKQTMKSQRVANKKEHRKVFLPPINFFSNKIYNPSLSTEIYNKSKKNSIKIIKKHTENESPFKIKYNLENIKSSLKEKENNSRNLNESIIINNSISRENKSKSEGINEEIIKSLNKIHDGIKMNRQNKAKTKSQSKKKFDFKMAQIYNIQFREGKKHNSTEKSVPNLSTK